MARRRSPRASRPRLLFEHPGVLAAGFAIVAVLVAADIALGSESVLAGTVVAAPLVVAVLAGPAETLAVALAALTAAAVSGEWNNNFFDRGWWLGIAIVAGGGLFAVQTSIARRRAEIAMDRFELLVAVSDVADGSLSLTETVNEILDRVVPVFGDLAAIDVLGESGGPRRLGARVHGPGSAEAEQALLRRTPSAPDAASGTTLAATTGRPQLLREVPYSALAAIASSEEDLALLRSLDLGSLIFVPLRARGRSFGALGVALRSDGRRYDEDDLRFAEVLAGRLSLALDNAGLFTELESVERRLDAVVSELAEAVTVQDANGRVIYANQAAAELMGYASPADMMRDDAEEMIARYELLHEDGTRVAIEELPGRSLLRGGPADPLLFRVIEKSTGIERWRLTKATAVRDGDGNVLYAVNIIEDLTDVKRAQRTQQLLAEAGAALASSLDYQQTLEEVAHMAVPSLADWCTVGLPAPDGTVPLVALAHVNERKAEIGRQVRDGYPPRLDDDGASADAINGGVSTLRRNISEERLRAGARDERHFELLRQMGTRSLMAVPMLAGARPVGVLSFGNTESHRQFDEDDLALAQELGRRAGMAVENARLYTERTQIAATLQRELRPPALPSIPGWQIRGHYQPAGEENEVGGDFYDAFAVGDGWMVVIGDVAGRGIEAASLTALARYTLRTAATLLGDPVAAVSELNRALRERRDLALCSVACAMLARSPAGASATIVCAGHPLPFLLRDGVPEQVGRFGTFLGVSDEQNWGAVEVSLEPGDQLVLYTDGVIDARGSADRFGEERLRETLTGARDPAEAIERAAAALAAFEAGSQSDDTAVVAIRLEASGTVPHPQTRAVESGSSG
jgi:PAS domain S-box-containing protein